MSEERIVSDAKKFAGEYCKARDISPGCIGSGYDYEDITEAVIAGYMQAMWDFSTSKTITLNDILDARRLLSK